VEDLDDIISGADTLDGFDLEAPEPQIRQPGPTDPERIPPGTAAGVGMRTRTTTPTERRRFYDLRNVPNAVGLIRPLPAPHETVHAIMGGDFAAWDLVPAIIELAQKTAAELWVATLGFNARNSYHLATLIAEGTIGRATVLCSDYFAKADAPTFREAKSRLESVGSTLTSTRNHAKILALDMGADCYVVEGSANLRSCNNLEQITISNSRHLLEFHAGWIRKVAANQ
jgi:hypothetical protein